MIYYENGRIYSEHYSYNIPEGLYFDFDCSVETEDGFAFISRDKRYTLEISKQILSPTITLEAIDEDEAFVSMSQISAVNRGGLLGKSLIYRSPGWLHEYYEEHLDIEPGVVLDICVTINGSRSKHEQIFDVMKEPAVVNFLNSIKAI